MRLTHPMRGPIVSIQPSRARRPGLHSIGGGRCRLAQYVGEGLCSIERLVARYPTTAHCATCSSAQIAVTAQADNDM